MCNCKLFIADVNISSTVSSTMSSTPTYTDNTIEGIVTTTEHIATTALLVHAEP